MQVLVTGWIVVDPSRRQALLEALRPHVQRTRLGEPGCLEYAFTADTVEADRIVVLERWADETALAAHFVHENMAATKRVLHAHGSGSSCIAKYRVDAAAPVRDGTGRYRADFADETGND